MTLGLTGVGKDPSLVYWQNFVDPRSTTLARCVNLGPVTLSARASGAMMRDGDGTLVLVGNEAPRFDHDKDGNALGLGPGEGAQSSVINYSRIDDWTNTDHTIVAGDAEIVRGVLLDKVQTASTGTFRDSTIASNEALASNGYFLVIGFIKQGTRPDGEDIAIRYQVTAGNHHVTILINFASGVLTYESLTGVGDGTAIDYGIEDFGDGLYRVWFRGQQTNAGALMGNIAFFTGYLDSSEAGEYVWAGGFTLIQNDSALPPVPAYFIPTSGASATRDDEEYYTDSVPAAITAASAMWKYVKVHTPLVFDPSGGTLHEDSDGTANERITIGYDSNAKPTLTVVAGGSTEAAITLTNALDPDTEYEFAYSFEVAADGAYFACSNGDSDSATPTDTPQADLTETKFMSNYDLSLPGWGWTKEVKGWVGAGTQAEIDALVGI